MIFNSLFQLDPVHKKTSGTGPPVKTLLLFGMFLALKAFSVYRYRYNSV